MKISSYLTEARIKRIEDALARLTYEFKKRRVQNPDLYLIDHSEFIQLFRISAKTSKNWRDQQLLPYAQINGKIYFKLADIKKLVNDHSVHLKKTNNQ